jgi:hypothetical protein
MLLSAMTVFSVFPARNFTKARKERAPGGDVPRSVRPAAATPLSGKALETTHAMSRQKKAPRERELKRGRQRALAGGQESKIKRATSSRLLKKSPRLRDQIIGRGFFHSWLGCAADS